MPRGPTNNLRPPETYIRASAADSSTGHFALRRRIELDECKPGLEYVVVLFEEVIYPCESGCGGESWLYEWGPRLLVGWDSIISFAY
jgi:hypothetical protein